MLCLLRGELQGCGGHDAHATRLACKPAGQPLRSVCWQACECLLQLNTPLSKMALSAGEKVAIKKITNVFDHVSGALAEQGVCVVEMGLARPAAGG